ncbi:MAG TPA: hypothetical protein VI299_17325 [Polyangiales bacterium]
MIQWICGQLDASYVGMPSTLALPHSDKDGRRYQLNVLRAAVREVRAIAPPEDARAPVIDPPPEEPAPQPLHPPFVHVASFRQARIDEAHVADVRGPGSYYRGALFDVRVSAVALSYATEKRGRAYGRMTGTVVACVVLPAEPAPERVPASTLIQEPLPPAPAGELHVPSAGDDTSSEPASEAMAPTPALDTPPRLLPALALCALVCVALALARGALPAVLWSVFMLPTLVARRMLAGVLPDTRGIHIVGAILVVVQLVCTAVLLQSWWSADCHDLPWLPLLGLIATLFPAGLLPSRIPLLCNALCLSAILFGWCASGAT